MTEKIKLTDKEIGFAKIPESLILDTEIHRKAIMVYAFLQLRKGVDSRLTFSVEDLIRELGYVPKGYQENRRVQYSYQGVEIDIDYWPLIPTYLEIEGSSEDDVYSVLSLLGLKKEDATTKDVESLYLDYGYNIEEIYNLKLEEERK